MARFLERWSYFMTKLFCGIDVAKYEHVASIYDPSTGEIILDSLHFDNNVKGFKSLLSHLSNLNKSREVVSVLSRPVTTTKLYSTI